MLRRLYEALSGRGRPGSIEGTIADRVLQRDVLRVLAVALEANDLLPAGDEPDWRVVSAELLEEPPISADGARLVGPWTERWIVEAAGKSLAFTIIFTPDATGATDFSVIPAQDAP